MVYIITKGKKVLTFGKGKDAFSTKKEAIAVKESVKKQKPRTKGIRIRKLKIR